MIDDVTIHGVHLDSTVPIAIETANVIDFRAVRVGLELVELVHDGIEAGLFNRNNVFIVCLELALPKDGFEIDWRGQKR